MILLLDTVASLVTTTWLWSGIFVYWAKVFGKLDHRALIPFRWCLAELRPFYLAAITVHVVYEVVTHHLGWLDMLSDALLYLNWWFYKDIDKDDDRWKRRRTKVAAKVKALASGRLVAIPAGASS